MIGTRPFGTSGVEASEIGFGAWTLGLDWWGKVDQTTATDLVHRALDHGITFFDVSDTYGAALAEERLGAALAGRSGFTIATKFGYDISAPTDQSGHAERPQCWDPVFIRSACEASMKRLGVETIDLYQLHNPRMGQIRDDDIYSTLNAMRADGKIRAYGVALGPAIGWQPEGVEALATRDIVALQTVYNVLEQEPGRTFLEAADGRAGIMARVPHASDALSGRFTPDTVFPATDHRSFRKREWLLRALLKVDQLEFLLDGRTISQAALAWILAQDGVTTVLPTVTNAEQLDEFAAAAERPLTPDENARVAELYARDFDLPPPQPEEQIALRTSAG